MFSLSSESMECIIRELGNVCAAQTFSGCYTVALGGCTYMELQGFSGNLTTWLKVYIGFGLGELHTSNPDSGIHMAIFWHLFVSLFENINFGDSQGICMEVSNFGDSQGICMEVRSSSISWPLLQTV